MRLPCDQPPCRPGSNASQRYDPHRTPRFSDWLILLARFPTKFAAAVIVSNFLRSSTHQTALRQPGIRIMFITGFAAVAMREEGLSPNRPRVLAKPFHLRHLIEEIEALLLE